MTPFQIYRVFREESELVENFTLDLVVHAIICLVISRPWHHSLESLSSDLCFTNPPHFNLLNHVRALWHHPPSYSCNLRAVGSASEFYWRSEYLERLPSRARVCRSN